MLLQSAERVLSGKLELRAGAGFLLSAMSGGLRIGSLPAIIPRSNMLDEMVQSKQIVDFEEEWATAKN